MKAGQRYGGCMARRYAAQLVMSLLLVLFLSAQCLAAEPLRGVALSIGQSDYLNQDLIKSLKTPKNDAREISKLLFNLGFDARAAFNLTNEQLSDRIDRFVADAERADVALLYYSGHGVQVDGENYLVPTDADQDGLWDPEADFTSVTQILNRLRARVPVVILLLDACRNNPYGASGLAPVNTPQGTSNFDMLVGFAAEPGLPAYEGKDAANSYYTVGILRHLSALDGASLADVMAMITNEVYLQTKGEQRPWTNMSLRRILYLGGTPQTPADEDEARRIGERRQLLLSIAATPQEMRKTIEAMAREQALPLDPLYGMLKQLNVDVSAGPAKIEEQLQLGAMKLKEFLAEARPPARKDPELKRLASLADRALAEGAISLAMSYRAKAVERVRDLSKIREADETADRIEFASTFADFAETAILNFDYQTAAKQYAAAYEMLEGRNEGIAFTYKLGEADALAGHGRYKGDLNALRESLTRYGEALALVKDEKDRQHWATANHNLSGALLSLGERERDTASLTKAISAMEAALSVWTRERAPEDWALAQFNLGNMLVALGERETGTASLGQAVAAFEAALTIRTRARMPLDWASTQASLGGAFRLLGKREASTAHLLKAIAAYEAALSEPKLDHFSLGWAAAQDGLGNALLDLSDHESGTDYILRSVAAHESALMIRTRERVPLLWADTKNNLGNSYLNLGRRGKNDEALFKAMDAYEAALTEYTRERAPIPWAAIQFNLGIVFQHLGEGKKDITYLNRAVAFFKSALLERTRQNTPFDWAATQHNLGDACLALSEFESDDSSLLSAIGFYEAALTVYTRKNAPYEWTEAQNGLGAAYYNLGQRDRNVTSLFKAKEFFETALMELKPDDRPLLWAMAQTGLGGTLLSIGVFEADIEALTKAKSAFEASLTRLSRDREPVKWALAWAGLGSVKLVLGELIDDKPMMTNGIEDIHVARDVLRAAGDTVNEERLRFLIEELERNDP